MKKSLKVILFSLSIGSMTTATISTVVSCGVFNPVRRDNGPDNKPFSPFSNLPLTPLGPTNGIPLTPEGGIPLGPTHIPGTAFGPTHIPGTTFGPTNGIPLTPSNWRPLGPTNGIPLGPTHIPGTKFGPTHIPGTTFGPTNGIPLGPTHIPGTNIGPLQPFNPWTRYNMTKAIKNNWNSSDIKYGRLSLDNISADKKCWLGIHSRYVDIQGHWWHGSQKGAFWVGLVYNYSIKSYSFWWHGYNSFLIKF